MTNEAEVPPQRIWLLKAIIAQQGLEWFNVPPELRHAAVEYVPASALAEVWKRAIAVVVGLPVEHYIYSGAHNMDARTFRDNAVKSLEAAMQVEAARDAALSVQKESDEADK